MVADIGIDEVSRPLALVVHDLTQKLAAYRLLSTLLFSTSF
jgi:hypothetical protein